MGKQTGTIILVMILLVSLCTASFFIGKGYANNKNNYLGDLAIYGYKHCIMYDTQTDNNFHYIMNSSDVPSNYEEFCS